jgi:phage baseplate assembly protein gpV
MIDAPDDTYSAAEAAVKLERSERQVHRYLDGGRLRGSKASGRWTVTALHIWEFQGIADEMMTNWRAYCRLAEAEQEVIENHKLSESGE